MRIAVMGSGGVGGYFGARLVKGGADVHFVARGAHLAAMRDHGLAVEGGPEAQLFARELDARRQGHESRPFPIYLDFRRLIGDVGQGRRLTLAEIILVSVLLSSGSTW